MIVIESDNVSVRLDKFGSTINSIIDKSANHEHYWQYDKNKWPRRTSVCFPICGGLIDNEYYYNGNKYQLPMHGFLREQTCSIDYITSDKVVFKLTDSEDSRRVYPFHFEVLISHSVHDNCVDIDYDVKNTGEEDMLFSIGSHYTYNLPSSQSECYYLFSKPQKAKSFTQTNGIIEDKENEVVFEKELIAMNHLFDVASKIYDTNELDTEYIAIGDKNGIFTKIEYSGFQYVVLWAPKGNNSPFACIEPWAGMADFKGHNKNFQDKKGIIVLQPGANKHFFQRITVF